MERVFPDTNVLYPISVADLTLRRGDLGLHEILWSEDLLSEVVRVLVRAESRSGLLARCDSLQARCGLLPPTKMP